MLKQDVPMRTGWFGYRKLDVENCIAHIRAAYAAELRLARQTQQGMEETMAQLRQENKALRQRFAQQAAAQAAASVRAEGSDKLQQLTRKLEAAHAEIRRYQTRLFACERQMIALRKENAALEAACEQAREEARRSAEETEQLRTALQQNSCAPAAQPAEEALPEPAAAAPVPEAASEPVPAAETPEQPAPAQEAAQQPPAEPEWKPKTELEHLSVELMNWFDEMMGA